MIYELREMINKLTSGLSKLKVLLKSDPYKGKSTQERFESIYHQNDWRDEESVSGPGSNTVQTEEVKQIVEDLITTHQISTILDVPCGDFGWMSQVNLHGANYIGGDIVPEIIDHNKEKYANRKDVTFMKLDITSDELPKVDLLIVRDCLVHLSHDLVLKALDNIRRSEIEHIVLTTFDEHSLNLDIHTGDWRPLNMCQAPFNLPAPSQLFNEKCTENNGQYADKCLGHWNRENL